MLRELHPGLLAGEFVVSRVAERGGDEPGAGQRHEAA